MIKLEERFNRLYEALLIEDIEAVRKQYPNISDNDFNIILHSDPTYKGNNSVGKFTKWMLNQFKKGNLQIDNNRLMVGTNVFDVRLDDYLQAQKETNINKDINSFKTPDELINATFNAKGKELTDRQKERQVRKAVKDAKLVYSDSDWDIYIPETYEADCALGKGSGWCTADTRTREHYDRYLRENGGQYYILISKFKPIERYQFHFESEQFFGAGTNQGHTPNREYDISYKEFADTYPNVKQFFDKQGYDENFRSNVFNTYRAFENYFTDEGQTEQGSDGTLYAYAEVKLSELMSCVAIDPFDTLLGVVNAEHGDDYIEEPEDAYSLFGGEFIHNSETKDRLNGIFNSVNKYIGYNVLPIIDNPKDLDDDLLLEILQNGVNESLRNTDILDAMVSNWFKPLSGMEYKDDYCKFFVTFNELVNTYEANGTGNIDNNDDFIDISIIEAHDYLEDNNVFDDADALVINADSEFINGRFNDIAQRYPTTLSLFLSIVLQNKSYFDIFIRDLAIATYDAIESAGHDIEQFEKYVEEDESQISNTKDDELWF